MNQEIKEPTLSKNGLPTNDSKIDSILYIEDQDNSFTSIASVLNSTPPENAALYTEVNTALLLLEALEPHDKNFQKNFLTRIYSYGKLDLPRTQVLYSHLNLREV